MNEIVFGALVNTLAVPFAIAAAAALIGRYAGLTAAGLAIAVGVLAGHLGGHVAVSHWPSVPPEGAVDKLLWMGLAGAALGVVLDRLADAQRRQIILVGALALGIVWIGWARIAALDGQALLVGLLILGFGVWTLNRLETTDRGGGLVLALIIVAATAGVGMYAASYKMAMLIGTLAAALAGAGAAAGTAPGGFGRAAQLAVAGPAIGLLTMLGLYTLAAPLALVLLAVIPLTTTLAAWVEERLAAAGAGRAGPALHMAIQGGLALLPAAAAVGVAYAEGSPLYA